jgi:hypothetical protein
LADDAGSLGAGGGEGGGRGGEESWALPEVEEEEGTETK